MRWTHNTLAPMEALWCPLRGFSGGVTLELYSGGYSLSERLKDPMSWELKSWTTSVCRKWSQEWLTLGVLLWRSLVKWSERAISASKVVLFLRWTLELVSIPAFLFRALRRAQEGFSGVSGIFTL
ncbi:hypothetical protein CG478_000910 [Bacillus cytotoxicus]|nr:hypothetical protein CG483_000910 [Bacillus cytotoxicus]AWC39247.1 hypothetical protein CG480_000910 [Bacillus cytotoxicus]AWC47178.1 hypothetical protein CG478_000910 [Bacillus cytotoxicus]AWC51199.1 hypothetical protein CG477_000910 [Bacillus cytotoxicus]AWC55328.1 hypothetical protein CG476_000910 [Bacillus cytotoxicus]